MKTLPVTAIVSVRNEEKNIGRCLEALGPAEHVVVVDSNSSDRTADIAREKGGEVVQFRYEGGYPKKRQWALDNLEIDTPWVLMLDADEVIPGALWDEIGEELEGGARHDAYFIKKGFHFMGRRFRFGGFSFENILLFRKGTARFERLLEDSPEDLDMEVHERMIVDGSVGRFQTPLVHKDRKDLESYLERHNKYSTWEAHLRYSFLREGKYGEQSVRPALFGNSQQRRRFLKKLVIRLPFEHLVWFLYHYIFMLGFLEGRPGYYAAKIRSHYILEVNAKFYELKKENR